MVCENCPCVKMISFDAARVPSPSCRPVGTVVCWPAAAPGCTMFWYSRSWNCARRILYPAVLALARLLAMLSTFSCWAVIPLAAL